MYMDICPYLTVYEFDNTQRIDLAVFFFFNDTATTEIYTEWIVGSVRGV